jgi:hypothetical protein
VETVVATAEALGVLLAMGALGFLLVRRRLIAAAGLDVLAVLSLDVALPCLIFTAILTRFQPRETPDWWHLPLWYAGFTAGALLLSLCALALARRGRRREFFASLFYQNAIFLPLAIIAELQGRLPVGLPELFLFTLFFSALLHGTAPLLLAGGASRIRWGRVFSPPPLATALALGVRLLLPPDRAPPEMLLALTEQLGRMTVPLLMVLLGGKICVDLQARGRLDWPGIGAFVLVKNLLFPLAAIGVLLLVRPPAPVAALILLQAAMPPVTSLPVLAERAGADRAAVSQFLLASFAVAPLSIPFALWLFERLSPGG